MLSEKYFWNSLIFQFQCQLHCNLFWLSIHFEWVLNFSVFFWCEVNLLSLDFESYGHINRNFDPRESILRWFTIKYFYFEITFDIFLCVWKTFDFCLIFLCFLKTSLNSFQIPLENKKWLFHLAYSLWKSHCPRLKYLFSFHVSNEWNRYLLQF